MESADYASFSLALHRRSVSKRIPVNGTMEITRRCPLQCSHCYNNLPMGDQAARSKELSAPEYERIIGEIAAAGCLWLLFTGGEIFARSDFLDIYALAKRAGMLTTLFTNGVMITPAIADRLAELPPFAIEITLYGRTRATYENLTGKPGSFDRCMRGIGLLLERSLPLKLKTVAVSANKHELWDMQRFAEEELGVPFKFDAMINPRLDCSLSPLAQRLTPEEVVALDLQDPRRVRDWQAFGCQFVAAPSHPQDGPALYACGGAVNSFAIDPYGRMSLCNFSQRDLFDLRKGSFKEGWESFLGGVRRRKITRLTKCVSCGLKSLCGMCPANGEMEHRDAEEPVDFLCHVAHLRAGAMGIPVPEHGGCEYCPGGERHEALLAEAERLKGASRGRLARPSGDDRVRRLPVLTPQAGAGREGLRAGSGCLRDDKSLMFSLRNLSKEVG